MHERDEMIVGSAPRFSVDQLESRCGMLGKSGADVGNTVAKVVHARPPSCKESADWRVREQRSQKLDPRIFGPDEDNFDALFGYQFFGGGIAIGKCAPNRDRFFERGNGDSNVVQCPLGHADGRSRWMVRFSAT